MPQSRNANATLLKGASVERYDPLSIRKPNDWVFEKSLVISVQGSGEYSKCIFFPALVREWNMDYTYNMLKRWTSASQYWRRIAGDEKYLPEQYYTPDGNRLDNGDGKNISKEVLDAFNEYGRLNTVLFAFLDGNRNHNISLQKLRNMHDVYGHLFVPEFIDIINGQIVEIGKKRMRFFNKID